MQASTRLQDTSLDIRLPNVWSCAVMYIIIQQCVFFTLVSGFGRANFKYMVFFMILYNALCFSEWLVLSLHPTSNLSPFSHTIEYDEIHLLIVSTNSKQNMLYSYKTVMHKLFRAQPEIPKWTTKEHFECEKSNNTHLITIDSSHEKPCTGECV